MSDAVRTELEPDAIREEDDGYHVDCPACGTSVTLMNIVEERECGQCGADLALELVWSE